MGFEVRCIQLSLGIWPTVSFAFSRSPAREWHSHAGLVLAPCHQDILLLHTEMLLFRVCQLVRLQSMQSISQGQVRNAPCKKTWILDLTIPMAFWMRSSFSEVACLIRDFGHSATDMCEGLDSSGDQKRVVTQHLQRP